MPPGRDSYVRAWSATKANITLIRTREDRITVTGELFPADVETVLVQLSLLRLERLDHFALKGTIEQGGGRPLWLDCTHATEPGRNLYPGRRIHSKRHRHVFAPKFVAHGPSAADGLKTSLWAWC